jgi:hypothetical protein
MKLKENKYTSKDGVEKVTYQIGKLNEYGEGIIVDTKIDFKLHFPPEIRPVSFKDRKTEQMKTFDSVKILATPSVEFENVVLNQTYNNATFQLADKYSQWVKDCQKDDVITVWLRSFEATDRDTGKLVRRSTWDCNINGVNMRKGEMQEKIDDQETVKEAVKNVEAKQTIAPAVAEVFKGPANSTVVDHTLPKEKQPELPVELTEWAKQFDHIKEDFKASFCNDGNYPKTFIEWVEDASACGTDYFQQFNEEDLRLIGAKTYFAICHRLGI